VSSLAKGPSSPDLTDATGYVRWDAPADEAWRSVSCTCGNGDAAEGHYLRCAKWVAVLPNHAGGKGSR
jgi:hypothetical protein